MHAFVEWVAHLATSPWGAVFLFSIAFAESSFFPIPPDVLMIPLCLQSPKSAFFFAGICTVGSVLGGAFGYFIGLKGGRPLLKRFLAESKILTAERLYQKYDVWAIGIAAFTPLPYKVFTVTAGLFQLNFKKFVLMSIIGRGARFFIVATLLFFFGETVQHYINKYLNVFSLVFVVLLVLGFIAVKHYAEWAHKKHLAEEAESQSQKGSAA